MSNAAKPDITREMLMETASYDPSTGVFTRTKSVFARHIGKPMGKINTCRHRQIKLFGRHYMAHRLAWLWVYGEWPNGILDHINGNPDDNRIANLRVCTPAQNQANTRTRMDNKSGRRGVYFNPSKGLWESYIQVRKVQLRLGAFKAREAAVAAREAAEIEHFGEFRRAG